MILNNIFCYWKRVFKLFIRNYFLVVLDFFVFYDFLFFKGYDNICLVEVK